MKKELCSDTATNRKPFPAPTDLRLEKKVVFSLKGNVAKTRNRQIRSRSRADHHDTGV